MAGPNPPVPGGGGPFSSPRVDFTNAVAARTGFDPRVIYAWEQGEGHPGDLPNYYNFMNIQSATARANRDPYVGVGPADTAIFGSLRGGVNATVDEINALGLGHEKGKSPSQQIADIAATNWASSHYGGPGGPNLRATFAGLYGPSALGGPAETQPLPKAGGGASGDQTKLKVPDPFGFIGSISDALGFLFSYRGLEVIGGGLLIIVGLVGLMREVGVRSPSIPGPAGTVATATGGE